MIEFKNISNNILSDKANLYQAVVFEVRVFQKKNVKFVVSIWQLSMDAYTCFRY